jgi:hypothetical protein
VTEIVEKIKRYRWEIFSAGITFLVAAILLSFSSLRYSTDDQFILFRYIDNIAEGRGFVYNMGEKVLGATTPLFTLVSALSKFIFPKSFTPDLVAWLNIIFSSAAAVYFYKICRKFLSEKISILAAALYALALAKMVQEGMETPLFLLTVFAFLHYLFADKFKHSSVWLSLALLTRPDAALIAVCALVYWWRKVGWRESIRLVVLCVLVALPWIIFATIYFGSFIPQSLLTKLHTDDIVNQSSAQALKVQLSGMSRLYWGKLFDPNNILLQTIFNLLPFFALAALGAWKKIDSKSWIIFAIPALYFISYSVSNPVMFPWYVSQLEPFWILASIFGLAVIVGKFNNQYLAIIATALLLAGPVINWYRLATFENLANEGSLPYVNVLRQNIAPGESVGVNNIGGIGYFIGGAYIFDFFGLTNDYAFAFYPVEGECVDKSRQYLIPPNLVMHTMPDWLFLAGEGELDPCFMQGRWFKENYRHFPSDEVGSNLIWKSNK